MQAVAAEKNPGLREEHLINHLVSLFGILQCCGGYRALGPFQQYPPDNPGMSEASGGELSELPGSGKPEILKCGCRNVEHVPGGQSAKVQKRLENNRRGKKISCPPLCIDGKFLPPQCARMPANGEK